MTKTHLTARGSYKVSVKKLYDKNPLNCQRKLQGFGEKAV